MARWINERLDKLGWSQRELGRRAGVSNTTISKVAAGEIEATFEFCAAIGRAFGERPEDVFRIAGLLPSSNGKMDDLDKDEKELVVSYRHLKSDLKPVALGLVKDLMNRWKEVK